MRPVLNSSLVAWLRSLKRKRNVRNTMPQTNAHVLATGVRIHLCSLVTRQSNIDGHTDTVVCLPRVGIHRPCGEAFNEINTNDVAIYVFSPRDSNS